MPLPAYNLQEKSDEALIEACRSGNIYAFDELMKRYIEPIYNFSKQYARNAEDAEDITQDSFYKAWKNVDQFTTGKAFRPWLYTIARNTALDYVKKRHSTSFSDLHDDQNDLAFSETLADTEPNPYEIFEQTKTASVLDALMSDLHPDHRAVIFMHYHQEMTFEEIAITMKKPMNTVKSWHRRALMKIRDKIVHRKHEFDRNQ